MTFASKATTIRPMENRRGIRKRLLESCAITAGLIAIGCAQSAAAQIGGSGVPTVPGAAILTPGINPNSTDVVVVGDGTNPHAIINWTPTDSASTGGTINFLPGTETLNFYGTDPDHVVLNRFVTAGGGSITRQIGLYGTINSYVGTPGGLANEQGGSIWFYNAGGILIGQDAVVNVGSLVLTANDIDTTGGLFGPDGRIRFRGAADSQSSIEIAAGGVINAAIPASPGASYLAMVAPRIVQQGTVSTDGSTAYVAAEQADIRINGGLFNIEVLAGAADGQVITHTGSTKGEAHLDANPNESRIYFVAVPKNDAVMMLVSGQVGYTEAATPQVEPNGAIRLSAGYNIVNGEQAAAPASSGAADMTVVDTLFTSSVFARASRAMTVGPLQQLPPPGLPVAPPGQGRVVVTGGNGTFIGDQSASLTVGENQIVGATGSFTLQSNGPNGSASALVDGGTLVVGTNLSIQAVTGIDAASGDGASGSAIFTQTGGTVSVGSLIVMADAVGQTRVGVSGQGIGGTAGVNLLGGSLSATNIHVSANGTGAAGSSGDNFMPIITPAGDGGGGRGGQATITIDGGAVNVGNITATTRGTGGTGGTFASSFGNSSNEHGGGGGVGFGGDAVINVVSGSLIASNLSADGSGIGGVGGLHFPSSNDGLSTWIGGGGSGGDGQGGSASILLSAPVTAVLSSIASGSGGAGGFGANGGDGGDGRGGVALLLVDDFDAGWLDVQINSHATGGAGSNGGDGDGGAGGAAFGGVSRFEVRGANGAAIIRPSHFLVTGEGGNGGNGNLVFNASPPTAPAGGDGGAGTGGTIEAVASDGGVVTLEAPAVPSIALYALGNGGDGGAGSGNNVAPGLHGGDGGGGGDGVGGGVRLISNGGLLTTNGAPLDLFSGGGPGSGGAAGIGTGASGDVGVSGAIGAGSILIDANGGQISLGHTTIGASGNLAGRVDLSSRDAGQVTMTHLVATAMGTTLPANGDYNSPTGLKVAVDDGVIIIDGDADLFTDGAFALSATRGGQIDVGGDLRIFAEDEILLRHATPQAGLPTIQVDGDFVGYGRNGVTAEPGITAASGGAFSLNATVGDVVFATIDSGGATSLVSSQGAVSIGQLVSAGLVTAEGEAVEIAGSGDLEFHALLARSGDITVSTDGDLTVPDVGAPGALSLSAGGILTGDVLGVIADAALSGAAGVQIDSLTSGGATLLTSSQGDVAIGELISAGVISAEAEALDIVGSGDLAFGVLEVRTGDAEVSTDGDLSLASSDVAGDVTLTSAGAISIDQLHAQGGVRMSAVDAIDADSVASGGATSLSSTQGAVSIGQLVSAGLVTAEGESVEIAGSGDLEFHALLARSGDITVSTDGDLTVPNVSAPGTLSLSAGGVLSGDVLGAIADATLSGAAGVQIDSLTSGGATLLTSSQGTVAIGELISAGVITVEAEALDIVGSGDLTFAILEARTGDAEVSTDGDLSLASSDVAGDVTLTSAGAISIDQLHAQGGVRMSAVDAIDADGVASGGATSLSSNQGAVTVGQLVSAGLVTTEGESVEIAGSGDLEFRTLVARAGDIIVSTDGDLTIPDVGAPGALSLSAGGILTGDGLSAVADATLSGDAGVEISSLTSGGVTSLTSSQGDVIVIDLASAGMIAVEANGVEIAGAGDLAFANLTATNALLAAGGDLTLDAVAVQSGLEASAAGMIRVSGAVTASNISLTSTDIDLLPGGQIGSAGATQVLRLRNSDTTAVTYLGGAAARSGYHLDADELSRLGAGHIRIVSATNSAGTAPSVVVDGLQMDGTNFGSSGALTIETPGTVSITGEVQLSGLTPDNLFAIDAGGDVAVLLGSGRIHMSGPDSAPAGQLHIEARNLFAATADAIADIGTLADTGQIVSRLAVNDGVSHEAGALIAGGVRFEVAEGVYIQNTGLSNEMEDRRGFTVGAGGLSLNTAGNGSLIVLNGVQIDGAKVIGGKELFSGISINGLSGEDLAMTGLDPASEINGCLIADGAACGFEPETPVFSFPIQDVVASELEGHWRNRFTPADDLIVIEEPDWLEGLVGAIAIRAQ